MIVRPLFLSRRARRQRLLDVATALVTGIVIGALIAAGF